MKSSSESRIRPLWNPSQSHVWCNSILALKGSLSHCLWAWRRGCVTFIPNSSCVTCQRRGLSSELDWGFPAIPAAGRALAQDLLKRSCQVEAEICPSCPPFTIHRAHAELDSPAFRAVWFPRLYCFLSLALYGHGFRCLRMWACVLGVMRGWSQHCGISASPQTSCITGAQRRGGGAASIGAEIPLWSILRTTVKQTVPL